MIRRIKDKGYNLSVKYSKKLGLDLPYFLKAGFWSNFMLGSETLFSLIFSILIVRTLTESDLGLWYWLVAVFGVFGMFNLGGFGTVATKSFIEGYYSSYSRILKIKFISSAIGSVILLGFCVHFYLTDSRLYFFFALMALMLFSRELTIFSAYLYAKDRFRTMALILFSIRFMYYFGAGLILALGYGLYYVFAAFFGIAALLNLAISIYFFYYIKSKEETKEKDPNLRLGFYFSFTQAILTGAQHLDKVLLPILFSLEELAIYGVALIVPVAFFAMIKKNINYLLFKKTKLISGSGLRLEVFKRMSFLTALYAVVCFAMYFVLKFYILQVLNTSYTDAIWYSEVLIISGFFLSLGNIFAKQYESKGMIIEYSKVLLIPRIFQMLLYLILIPLFGVWGAVISRSLGNVMVFLISLVPVSVFRKLLPFRYMQK